jgi:hypothetical protein
LKDASTIRLNDNVTTAFVLALFNGAIGMALVNYFPRWAGSDPFGLPFIMVVGGFAFSAPTFDEWFERKKS